MQPTKTISFFLLKLRCNLLAKDHFPALQMLLLLIGLLLLVLHDLFTHWFFDDNVIIWNFRSIDRFNKRPTHLVCLSRNKIQWSLQYYCTTYRHVTAQHVVIYNNYTAMHYWITLHGHMGELVAKQLAGLTCHLAWVLALVKVTLS